MGITKVARAESNTLHAYVSSEWYLVYLLRILFWPENQAWRIGKKDSKDQKSIQSSTTPVPGYQMGT